MCAPAPLRDLLMRLALTDLFRAKWTNEIHNEWISNVLANRSDMTKAILERTRDLVDFPGHIVELRKLKRIKVITFFS